MSCLSMSLSRRPAEGCMRLPRESWAELDAPETIRRVPQRAGRRKKNKKAVETCCTFRLARHTLAGGFYLQPDT